MPKTLPILLANNPFLRKKALTVQSKDLPEVRQLIPVLFNTMYEAEGIGLAAPQVGIGLRFFVMDLSNSEKIDKHIIINPEFIERSKECSESQEGCLSFPQQFSEVIRPNTITLRFMNIEGQIEEMNAEGLLARCIQHETDHLNGILFVDHISSLKRNMIMRKIIKDMKKNHTP
ncbi:Peptide deformylase [Commensalibacter sp. Nvir]|uniref:peptide deformylase n=1 Tax=Commensalibacter sp. Nvir TaxID=3069817 RepID=UPI002D40F959|nr:Peptide deformylase [Commensalibacter sp. Nvir]